MIGKYELFKSIPQGCAMPQPCRPPHDTPATGHAVPCQAVAVERRAVVVCEAWRCVMPCRAMPCQQPCDTPFGTHPPSEPHIDTTSTHDPFGTTLPSRPYSLVSGWSREDHTRSCRDNMALRCVVVCIGLSSLYRTIYRSLY